MRRGAQFTVSIFCLTLAVGLGSAGTVSAFETYRGADGSVSRISPATTTQPLEVVLWVRPGVSASAEAGIVAKIRQGLQMWEDVPTSHLRFTTTIVHGAVQPARAPQQLLVRIATLATIKNDPPPNSGASPPVDGAAGIWWGAVADGGGSAGYALAAAHEVGHALGLTHSSIGYDAFPDMQPIMHWASQGTSVLQPDDAAGISFLYPDPVNRPETLLGTIKARFSSLGSGQPLDGVNVVAVNRATGRPAVARVSGAAGTPGVAEVRGLQPGNYDLRVLDGHSFAGCCLSINENAIQADNFTTRTLGPYAVTAGSQTDLGMVALAIGSNSFDGFRKDIYSGTSIDFPSSSGLLPTIRRNKPYDIWAHVAGGVRPLTLQSVTDLPAGITASLQDVYTFMDMRYIGQDWIRLSGTATQVGRYHPRFTIRDGHGTVRTIDTQIDVPTLALGAGTQIYMPSKPTDIISMKGTAAALTPAPGQTYEGVWKLRVAAVHPVNTGLDYRVDVPVTCQLPTSCKGSIREGAPTSGRRISFLARKIADGWSVSLRSRERIVRATPVGNELVDVSVCPPAATVSGTGVCAQGTYSFRLGNDDDPYVFKLYK